MDTPHILVVSGNADILATILRLIKDQSAWTAQGATDEQAAKTLLARGTYDVVLLGGALTTETETRLREWVASAHPATKVVSHYGGGSGLLFGEVLQALHEPVGLK